jgi:ApbE superfamily uncharacterized protein (UPF0280 family)
VLTKQLVKVRRRFNESNVLFQSDKPEAIDAAIHAIVYHRLELETYIRFHPNYAETLQPLEVDPVAPLIVRKMAEAAARADVGPMAAVAGALADEAVDAMIRAGSKVSIVEDGGEVSADSEEAFTVALNAGPNALGRGIGFSIEPSDCPIGIATSSATVSHALSFGEADAATVFAEDAAHADAAATAVCNAVVGEDVVRSIELGLEAVKRLSHLRGALIVRGDHIGSVGWIPQIVGVEE